MSMSGFLRKGWGVVLIGVLVGATGVAWADVPEVVFEITAQSGPLGASYSVLAEWGEYDPATQTWTYAMPEAFEFWADDVFLGSLDTFTAEIVGDPEVNLTFAVQAGSADIDFHIASALLSDFDPIVNASGYARASYTLTDFDGGSATLTGIGDTGGAYLAQYNGWAGTPEGTTFGEGIYSMSAGFLETVTMDYAYPETGYMPIGDTVVDMSALVSFGLTAQDLASGTSSYVIPEPGGALALLTIGLAAARRRRR